MKIGYKPTICKEHNQNLTLICTENNCSSNRIICSQCKLFSHSDHIIRPLNIILKQISNDLLPQTRNLYLTATIDSFYYQFISISKTFHGEVTCLEKEIVKFFRNLYKKIHQYPYLCNNIIEEAVKGEYSSFKEYYFYQKNQQGKKIIEFLSQKLQDIKIRINERQLSNLLRILQPFSQNHNPIYRFSQKLKHPNIQLSNNNTTITQQISYSNNIILIQPKVDNKNMLKNKKIIKFKIDKPISWLSIGIAYAKIVKTNNYNQITNDLGHGTIVTSYQGYSFHHSNINFNSFYNSFPFKQSEIIILTIDTRTHKLYYQKESLQIFQLSYENNNNDDIYFCACVSSPSESLTIL